MCVIFIEAHPDIKQDLCEMNIFMFGRAMSWLDLFWKNFHIHRENHCKQGYQIVNNLKINLTSI